MYVPLLNILRNLSTKTTVDRTKTTVDSKQSVASKKDNYELRIKNYKWKKPFEASKIYNSYNL